MFHKCLIFKLFANKTGLHVANVIVNHQIVFNKFLVDVLYHFLSISVKSLVNTLNAGTKLK